MISEQLQLPPTGPIFDGLNCNRTSLRNKELARIVEISAILTKTPQEEFNINAIPDKILALPAPQTRMKADEDLIKASSDLIVFIGSIKENFDNLKLNVEQALLEDIQVEGLIKGLVEGLESFQAFYKILSEKIINTLATSDELLEQLQTRIQKDAKVKTPSENALQVISNSQKIDLDYIKTKFLEFHAHTKKLEKFPTDIKKALEDMNGSKSEFKKYYCYAAYLHVHKLSPSTFNWGCFFGGYSTGSYNYIDQLLFTKALPDLLEVKTT